MRLRTHVSHASHALSVNLIYASHQIEWNGIETNIPRHSMIIFFFFIVITRSDDHLQISTYTFYTVPDI